MEYRSRYWIKPEDTADEDPWEEVNLAYVTYLVDEAFSTTTETDERIRTKRKTMSRIRNHDIVIVQDL